VRPLVVTPLPKGSETATLASSPATALTWMRTAHRTLAAGPGLFATAQLFGLALSFAGSALMVRVASPSAIASYLLFLQSVMAISVLMQAGLAPATLRFAPLARGAGGDTSTAVLRRRLLALLVVTWVIVAIPTLVWWPTIAQRLDAPELSGAATVVLATAALLALNQVIDAYTRSFRHYTSSALIGDVTPRVLIASAFAACVALHVEATWTSLGTIFITAQVMTALAYARALFATTAAETSEQRSATTPPALRSVIAVAGTMGVRAGVSIVVGASALWVLSWARPHEEVAVYGVMLSIGQLVGLTAAVAGRLIPQEISVLYEERRLPELERLVRSAATVVAVVTLATAFVLVAGGRPLIRIAYGSPYVVGWPVLLILALAAFVDGATGLAGYVLQSTGHHRILLHLTIAAALVNIALSIVLVRPFGAIGIAVSTAASLVVFNVAMAVAVRRLVGIHTIAYPRPNAWVPAVREMLRGHFAAPIEMPR
jgi:O-antigen/teichoic acid export membrane protein